LILYFLACFDSSDYFVLLQKIFNQASNALDSILFFIRCEHVHIIGFSLPMHH